MYDVSITNNYSHGLFLDGGNQVIAAPNGGKAQFTKWGSHAITVPYMGDINFIDIAAKKLDGYNDPNLPWTQKTWGGLVRYQSLEAYFRYEGEGKIELVVDEYGSISLHFDQGGDIIQVPDMTVV